MDETWVCHNEPESKRQFLEWKDTENITNTAAIKEGPAESSGPLKVSSKLIFLKKMQMK